jgi:hypothetical protein
MQRDYILRLIEQVAQLLSRAIRQRDTSSPHEALQSIMAAFERLFGMEAVQIFRFSPEQHAVMLAENELPDVAHQKLLMYAALNEEAGHCYSRLGQTALAQQTFLNALRFTLKARADYPAFESPAFAPDPTKLQLLIDPASLDEETARWLQSLAQVSPKQTS